MTSSTGLMSPIEYDLSSQCSWLYRCLHRTAPPYLMDSLYTHSRSHWPSTSAFCHTAEVGRTALSIEQFRWSAPFCGGPVDLEFAARQSSRPRTESRYFQTSAEDIHFCEILMTKCIKHIRDLFEYALYKFTLCFTLLCGKWVNFVVWWGCPRKVVS